MASANELSAYKGGTAIQGILNLAPSLRNITVLLTGGGSLHQPADPAVRSPELREILLLGLPSHDRTASIVDVLASIDAPELEKIAVVHCWTWNSQCIPTLLQRSRCFLETLVLQQYHLRPAHLIALSLRCHPLRHSYSPTTTISNAVLGALTFKLPVTRDGGTLPVLHTLALSGSYMFSTSNLLAILESRMDSQPSLVKIDISLSHRKISPPELSRLAAITKVLSEDLARSWFIFTVPRWRYKPYSPWW
ncbi:hypothetical protein K438DRAFT_1936738 [Mycena galopus ATCC 62051]|nr:hypothetical protein K438DRAFT_1936738 [Mycena galopus ATCC 62051]